MTIEEAKQLQYSTERKISELLLKFQDETKLRVKDVELHSEDIQGNFAIRLHINW